LRHYDAAHKGKHTFPNILKSKVNVKLPDSYQKSFILGNGPVCHSIDRRDYKAK